MTAERRSGADRPPDAGAKARTRALRYLQTRERSLLEVRERLRRYGYDEDLVAEVTAWLEQIGLLDQDRFARFLATARLNAGWSRRRILAELAGKGVTFPEAEEAVNAVAAASMASVETGPVEGDPAGDEAGEDALLVGLVRRRFGRQLVEDPEGGQRRALAFLVRRGHDWERARRVIRAVSEALLRG
jgi:regulatory protein